MLLPSKKPARWDVMQSQPRVVLTMLIGLCQQASHSRLGEGPEKRCTCLAIHLYFLYQELLKLANLHDFVFHGLCAVNCERLRLSLASGWALRLLFQNLDHLAGLSLMPRPQHPGNRAALLSKRDGPVHKPDGGSARKMSTFEGAV